MPCWGGGPPRRTSFEGLPGKACASRGARPVSCRLGAGWRSESPACEVPGHLGPITGALLTQAQPHPTLIKAVPATAPAPGSWGRGPPALDPPFIPTQPWCPIHSGGAHVLLSSLPWLFAQDGILTVSKVTLRPHWTPWMGCPLPPPHRPHPGLWVTHGPGALWPPWPLPLQQLLTCPPVL